MALPLSLALAIAIGVPPQHGLYTAIVAGALIAILGGSRHQISGPTAAFVAILVPVVQTWGLGGLLLATMLAGLMQIALGVLRLGRYVEFVPYPVVTGFTTGIAVTIATGQLATLLGMEGVAPRAHWHETVGDLLAAAGTVDGWDLATGLLALLLLVLSPRLWPRAPAPLVAVLGATLAALLLNATGAADVATIGSRFTYVAADGSVHAGIPPSLPQWRWPWELAGRDGAPLSLDYQQWKQLLLAGATICMLGAIESLLSAVVADGMAGTRHDPDSELLAQGVGNVVAPFLGGFAATGAIARTATSVRSGARSPLAAVVHALFLLLAVLALAPWLGHVPMPALAAVLLTVAWRMADLRHVVHVLRTAPASDAAVLATCCGLTVGFDMVVGVVGGMMLAAVLFLRRMAELTGARLLRDRHPHARVPIPQGVLVYDLDGPLFFGAAARAMSALHAIGGDQQVVVVLDFEGVPTIDATGLVNLQSALARLHAGRTRVVLACLKEQVRARLRRAGIRADDGLLFERQDLGEAVALAGSLSGAGAAGEAVV